jgi:hypothetical protein
MKRELRELIAKHSKIFGDGHFRYFECGPGWYSIIDEMAEEIQARIDASGCEQLVANQFKEKFGEVRFYFRGGDDECKDIVSRAVARSNETCDLCGAPGEMGNGGGWVSVRCHEHFGVRRGDFVS